MVETKTKSSRYLVLDVAGGDRVRALAEESALGDRDLDAIEARLGSAELDPGEAAALALALGRAGRPRSSGALQALRRRLEGMGRPAEAHAVTLALDLLAARPPVRVERADLGYRHHDVALGVELFVEDPLAAHWHARGRWGPPIRPDLERAPIFAQGPGLVDRLTAFAEDGGIVVVGFEPRWRFSAPLPPLRLTRAGVSRDAGLRSLSRWSQVDSVGVVAQGTKQCAAYEVSGEPVEILPPKPSIPTEDLVDLMGRLLKRSRS